MGNGDIKITQTLYAKKILEQFNFESCNPVSTPILQVSESSESGKASETNHKFPYRQAVGALMYLMLGSRPDLAFSVGFLSRSLENPSVEDVARLKRVFRYIAGTTEKGIIYRNKSRKGIFECYSDADLGGCRKTGRSTSGVLVNYANGAVSWLSRRQDSVTESMTEAEIVAASEAAKEIIWLSRLLREMTELQDVPILQVDNAGAIRLTENPENHRRTKHIQRKHFFIRECVAEGRIAVQKVSSENQAADIFTKPLASQRLRTICIRMGLL